jgi:hypothetical protein
VIRFVYIPPIDCPCEKRLAPSKCTICPAGIWSAGHAVRVAGSMVIFVSAARSMRCSMIPWRKLPRREARFVTWRYSVSLAPGTRSGFSGRAAPAIAKP